MFRLIFLHVIYFFHVFLLSSTLLSYLTHEDKLFKFIQSSTIIFCMCVTSLCGFINVIFFAVLIKLAFVYSTKIFSPKGHRHSCKFYLKAPVAVSFSTLSWFFRDPATGALIYSNITKIWRQDFFYSDKKRFHKF